MKAYPEYKDSGVEWLGEVPAGWEVSRLKTLFQIRKRIAGELGHDVLSVTQKGLKVKDLESNDGQLSMDYSKYQLVEPDDFVMNHMDLLTGYVDVASCYGVTSPDYRVFSSISDRVWKPYFLYLMQHGYQRRIFYAFGQGASGFGRWRMPTESFQNFQSPVPPLPEQRKIAAFLDLEVAKIDGLIEEQRRLIALLAEKRQATISHAVTKGLNPNAKLKPSGIDWPQNIPEDWEVLSLTRVVRKFVDYRGVTPTKVDSGVPLVTATQIKNGRIEHELDPVYITEEEYKTRMTRGWPEIGDVLLTTEAPLGETAQIVDPHVSPGQRIILMKVESDLIKNDYLFTHFRSQFGQNQLWERASGSTASGIRADRLRGSSVLVPPLEEQEKIVAHVNQITSVFEEIQNNANAQITLLQERRSALISAAVTGKIDLRDFDDSSIE